MVKVKYDWRRFYAYKLAWKYIGKFYKWGGDDPSGFDCSGFVIEILKSVGILPRKYDNTAEGLFFKFFKNKVKKAYRGCLVFYGDPITHVEFCIDDTFSIGASGGGRDCTTIEDAIRKNAFVKLRPILRNRKIYGYVDPFKKEV